MVKMVNLICILPQLFLKKGHWCLVGPGPQGCWEAKAGPPVCSGDRGTGSWRQQEGLYCGEKGGPVMQELSRGPGKEDA